MAEQLRIEPGYIKMDLLNAEACVIIVFGG